MGFKRETQQVTSHLFSWTKHTLKQLTKILKLIILYIYSFKIQNHNWNWFFSNQNSYQDIMNHISKNRIKMKVSKIKHIIINSQILKDLQNILWSHLKWLFVMLGLVIKKKTILLSVEIVILYKVQWLEYPILNFNK